MSMEQAILELAAAMRENTVGVKMLADLVKQSFAMERGAPPRVAAPAVEQVADPGTESVKPDADLEQAVQKVEATAKKESAEEKPSGEASAANGAASSELAEPLDYAKDVRPVLLAAIRKAGKEKVQELLGAFGVEKADKLTVDQLPAVLDAAQKLAA